MINPVAHAKDCPIIEETDRYIIVCKPNNISSEEVALKFAHGLQNVSLVYSLPHNIGGLLIIPKSKLDASILRNDYGSYRFQLTFDVISTTTMLPKDMPISCELPIAKHDTKDLYLISSTTGKKSSTTFTFLEKIGKCEHWQASCTYLRNDQISIHAYESGINILGDIKYAKCPIPSFKELKRNFKDNRKEDNEYPFHGPAIYLSALKFPDKSILQINLPKKMSVFMKLLSLT
ncbi:MAG: hypothetical protein K2L13_02660 [Opitutales bacterium]|nr:hypothetical protein [Opitutales bacterium]